MDDERMDRAIENIKNLTTQMVPILKEMAQKVIRNIRYLFIELGLIKPRHRYHTKRVAVRKRQLRRLRK